ncbi:MAG: methyltransferase domain-containing protein [Planctomycetaceae bacterium]|nr:methyltransferase domain-containing protein [Planctomycetaceae bacterium]
MNRNPRHDNSPPAKPGELEIEAGVPIPGIILEQENWTKTGIKQLPAPNSVDWHEIFGRQAPWVVELGCGNGRFAVSSAVRHPEWDHMAVDILPMVIRYATRRGNQRGLNNVRFLVCGGSEFIRDYFVDGSIHQLHIYHPQPYREPGQEQKRLLSPEFLILAHRRLASGGTFFFQTDNPAYWSYFQNAVKPLFEITATPESWEEDPKGRTRREIVAKSQGLSIFRAVATKVEVDEATYASYLQSAPSAEFDAMDSHPQCDSRSRRGRHQRRGRHHRRGRRR